MKFSLLVFLTGSLIAEGRHGFIKAFADCVINLCTLMRPVALLDKKGMYDTCDGLYLIKKNRCPPLHQEPALARFKFA